MAAQPDKKTVIKDLLELGKSKGQLSTKEILDALGELDFDPEQIEKFYDTLESQGVEIVEDFDDITIDDEELAKAEGIELEPAEKTPLSLSRGSSRSICKIWMASSTFFWRASPSRGRSARSSRVASSSRLAWLSKGPRRAMRDSAWGFIPARVVEGLSAAGLLLGDLAKVHQILHIGVVHGNLGEDAPVAQVGTAVPHVGHVEGALGCHQQHHRGAHAVKLRGLLYLLDGVIQHTTLNLHFYKVSKEEK